MAPATATPSVVALERRSPARNAAHLNATTRAAAPSIAASVPNAIGASGRGHQMLGWLEDAGLLVVLALAFPLVILVVGTPVVLVVRLLLGIARRLL